MSIGMLLPVLLLIGVAVGWVMTAFAARRRGELARRIESVVSGRPLSPVASQSASIRLRRKESPRLERAAHFLQMPLGLPLANVFPPVSIFILGTMLAGGSIWLCQFLASTWLSVVAGLVVWIIVVRGMFAWELGRYQAKLLRQLPDTIQLVVSATRAGLPVSEAFRAISEEMASPTREEFVRVEREMSLGSTPDEALLALHKRTKVTEYAIFAVTIGVQARSGGRLAETIQNLAETVRERLAITSRAKALAGEAKVSAIIMCILPVVAGVLLSIVNPKHMSVLFHDPRGVHMFSIGIVTLLLGIFTMRQLIRGASKG
jgi:tight adherence protein B